MTTETHTPGPWSFDGPADNHIVWSGPDNRICFMAHSNGVDPERDTANARLIAAAPDGLAANKAFVEAVESGAGVQDGMTPDQAYTEVLIQYGHSVATAYDAARAAIAKAEGRS